MGVSLSFSRVCEVIVCDEASLMLSVVVGGWVWCGWVWVCDSERFITLARLSLSLSLSLSIYYMHMGPATRMHSKGNV